MAKTLFSIAYDGPALVDGTMDVRDLAPALLATSELFTSASRILYGKDAEVKVSISATDSGSFEVILDLVMSAWDKIVDMFKGDSAEALERLIAIILGTGTVATGVFALYKKIKGRKDAKVEQLKNNKIAITIGENRIEIDKNVYLVYSSPDTQIAIQKLVQEPLKRAGITEFKSSYQDVTVTVSKEESEYFSHPPSSEEQVTESSRQVAFKILSVSFKEDNKWRLSDGSSTIYAEMADEHFLDRIEKNLVSFSKGDTLVCTVRTTQTLDANGGLKATHIIERVVKHIPPSSQLEIPNDE